MMEFNSIGEMFLTTFGTVVIIIGAYIAMINKL